MLSTVFISNYWLEIGEKKKKRKNDRERWKKRANEIIIEEPKVEWIVFSLNWIFIWSMNRYFTLLSQSVMPISKRDKDYEHSKLPFSYLHNNCIVFSSSFYHLEDRVNTKSKKKKKTVTKFFVLQKKFFISRPEYLMLASCSGSCWRIKFIHIVFVHVLSFHVIFVL